MKAIRVQDDGATHAYIGVAKCGCVVAATADAPYRKMHVAEDVAGFLKSGLIIERVTILAARKLLTRCRCKEPENQPLLPV